MTFPDLPIESMKNMARDEDIYIRRFVAEHPSISSLPLEVIWELARHTICYSGPDKGKLMSVPIFGQGGKKDSPCSWLHLHAIWSLRQGRYWTMCPYGGYWTMSTYESDSAWYQLMKNENLLPEIKTELLRLREEEYHQSYKQALMDFCYDKSVVKDWERDYELAVDPNTPAETLHSLSLNDDWYIQKTVQNNPSTDFNTLGDMFIKNKRHGKVVERIYDVFRLKCKDPEEFKKSISEYIGQPIKTLPEDPVECKKEVLELLQTKFIFSKNMSTALKNLPENPDECKKEVAKLLRAQYIYMKNMYEKYN